MPWQSHANTISIVGAKGRCEPALEVVSFHNEEVAIRLRKGVNQATLHELVEFLLVKGAFKINVSSSGLVPAADNGEHNGGYGQYFWLRDKARIYTGVAAFRDLLAELYKYQPTSLIKEALEQYQSYARKIALAMIRIYDDPNWLGSVLANIADPSLHLNPEIGYRSVPKVRLMLKPYDQFRPHTESEREQEDKWGHKQNDALAEFAHVILDAVNEGDLNGEDFSAQAKTAFTLMPAYFVRLRYWEMWDVGAWEEISALHASSVGLATSFLERFNRGFNNHLMSDTSSPPPEQNFFNSLKKNSLHGINEPQLRNVIAQAISGSDIFKAIDLGYSILNQQLFAARPSEAVKGMPGGLRDEDTAILHIFWHMPKRYSDADSLQLIEKLNVLKRRSGFARYESDWFLHSSAIFQFATKLPFGNKLAILDENGKFRVARTDEINQIANEHAAQIWRKDMSRIGQWLGKILEANWTFPDGIQAQALSKISTTTKDPAVLQMAINSFLRFSAQITSSDELTTEGAQVIDARFPEARTPVMIVDHDEIKIVELVSPNSPLNWAMAEYQLALFDLWKALSFWSGKSVKPKLELAAQKPKLQ
jgi:hypothetical protein